MNLLGKLASLKIIWTRARDYFSAAQFAMVLYLFASQIKQGSLSFILGDVNTFTILILAILGILAIGYLDYRFFLKQEVFKQSLKSPWTIYTITFYQTLWDSLKFLINEKTPKSEKSKMLLEKIELAENKLDAIIQQTM